jgi:prophage regulatory protein
MNKSTYILKIGEVVKKTGLSKSQIHRMIAAESFPMAIKIGFRASGWIESEVEDWISERIILSRKVA